VAADREQVLVVNSGSSSVKLALVDPSSAQRVLTVLAECVGAAGTTVRIRRGEEEESTEPRDGSHRGIVAHVLDRLTDEERGSLSAVGHRVVHGGPRFSESVVVDDDVLDGLREVVQLAPLHVPANIAGIEAARDALPDIEQVAVFDTAFHRTMPAVAHRYAVPQSWYDEHHVRRYGAHGTSHRYLADRTAEVLGRPSEGLRLVTLHLGNGCSAAAVLDGRSVDTTMGLTPLEGMVMGTRSGDVDPNLVGYASRRLGLDLDGVLEVLTTGSGLLGLSGMSNDMRTLTDAARDGSEAARLAVDVFCYRAAKAVAGLIVALGRLDALVFSGGIGEHSAEVRSLVLGHLEFLGLAVDEQANAEHGARTAGRVSAGDAPVALVLATDEEVVIARDTSALVRSAVDDLIQRPAR
jgi:acetate kinase